MLRNSSTSFFALLISTEFNSQRNKDAIVEGLIKLENIVNQEGITGKELNQHTQSVRDTVFENLVQRGAIMEFLKDGIKNFKKISGAIDPEYLGWFAKQIKEYRLICENAPVKSLE